MANSLTPCTLAPRASTATQLAVLVAALCAVTGAAHAARPMNTDDARVVDAKACQVETWLRDNRGSGEYWALPACNPTGNLELTLGGTHAHGAHVDSGNGLVLQGKTLFKPLEANGWGMGLAVGTVRHFGPRHSHDVYAYVPTSYSFANDRAVLHTNLGWLHESATHRDRMTWGLGTETRMTGRAWLIAETFGQNRGRPQYQLGLRYWVVPDRVQVDATYGNRFGSNSQARWFSLGLRLLTPAFLP